MGKYKEELIKMPLWCRVFGHHLEEFDKTTNRVAVRCTRCGYAMIQPKISFKSRSNFDTTIKNILGKKK